uniref:Uncharacterized protein n=1 Tax=Glossina pallidipes TaxID=7398 RepID=A0A1A9ZT68_GLOPL
MLIYSAESRDVPYNDKTYCKINTAWRLMKKIGKHSAQADQSKSRLKNSQSVVTAQQKVVLGMSLVVNLVKNLKLGYQNRVNAASTTALSQPLPKIKIALTNSFFNSDDKIIFSSDPKIALTNSFFNSDDKIIFSSDPFLKASTYLQRETILIINAIVLMLHVISSPPAVLLVLVSQCLSFILLDLRCTLIELPVYLTWALMSAKYEEKSAEKQQVSKYTFIKNPMCGTQETKRNETKLLILLKIGASLSTTTNTNHKKLEK